MSNINYSIIIPHKNVPQLLQRCLDSIPIRDDVQVIVVDDNSDTEKVDFNNFPKWNGKNYEYHLTKEGKGAGYARNVGIKHAIGKWLLFADADDEYSTANLAKLLDVQKDKYDVICWPTEIKNQDGTTEPYTMSWRYGKETFNSIFEGQYKIYDNYLPDILFVLYAPWQKMVRRDIVTQHKLSFSEIPACNDIFFSISLATTTTNIGVYSDITYTYIKRSDSISVVNIYKRNETQRLEFHLKELFKVQRILNELNKNRYLEVELGYVFDLFEKISIKKTLLFCLIQMKEVSPAIGFKSLKRYMTYHNSKILFSSFFNRFFEKKANTIQ